jgi:hypothetical protein
MSLGVEIGLEFMEPTQPTIVPNGDQLCAEPAGASHQWFLNGEALTGSSACITPTAPGAYTVDATYAVDCSVPSEPFLITGVEDHAGHPAPRVYPTPARDEVTVDLPVHVNGGNWKLMDATGREVMRGAMPPQSPLRFQVDGLPAGSYWLRLPGQPLVPVSVAR